MKRIKEKLDEYLEFDSDLLFNIIPTEETRVQCKRLTRIFGGALRDIIAKQKINDIDILVGARSIKALQKVLSDNEYTHMESLIGRDISSLYHDINIITEPQTWVKCTKIVQLIKPVVIMPSISISEKNRLNMASQAPPNISILPEIKTKLKEREDIYIKAFVDLIQNVDISACGLSYDGKNLYENFPDAILHCKNKVYYLNTFAKMYSIKRSTNRLAKFVDRGWSEIDLIENRDIKINSVLDENEDYPHILEINNESNGCYKYNKRFKII